MSRDGSQSQLVNSYFAIAHYFGALSSFKLVVEHCSVVGLRFVQKRYLTPLLTSANLFTASGGSRLTIDPPSPQIITRILSEKVPTKRESSPFSSTSSSKPLSNVDLPYSYCDFSGKTAFSELLFLAFSLSGGRLFLFIARRFFSASIRFIFSSSGQSLHSLI